MRRLCGGGGLELECERRLCGGGGLELECEQAMWRRGVRVGVRGGYVEEGG